MKKSICLFPVFLACFVSTLHAQIFPFQNPALPLNTRVNDLISRLTLQEKAWQMVNSTPAIPRLHIPAYNWWSEALHGVARSGVATVFPQAIGMAATFDDSLIQRVAAVVSDEARAMYNVAARKGYSEQYGGLSFWTPNINIFRDPRWGRGQETYGEDPYLTSRMGVAFVKGLQGDNPRYLEVAACAKHFAVHSGPERLRHRFDAEVSRKDLYETYLPAFKALVEKAGVEAVMCAYNSTDGEPCCANPFLLEEVLRHQWGFKGHILSDCGALADIYGGHKAAPDKVHAAAIALQRGVSLNCGDVYLALPEAVKKGLVTEKQVDTALAILLRTRFKLGLFDPPGHDPYDHIPASDINSPAHRRLARTVAEKSIVLLKNDGVLPLKTGLARYFVTGPNASNLDVLMGNYYGVNDQMSTILEGIARHVPPGSQLRYRQGILLDRPNINPIDWTTGEAKGADATILVMGISGLLEGEEGESIASPSFGDRLDYNLPQNQVDFLKKLKEGNDKPVIAVITGGSPMNLKEVDSIADAVLLVWYPGEEGGNAVGDILFGDVSPSGRLPVTFPRSLDQLPPYEDYSMKGRTYRYMTAEPMYPFGFGLSYTSFRYSRLELSQKTPGPGETLQARVTVTNTGHVKGDEVVQLYLTHESSGLVTPLYSLKGFKRISLAPGASAEVTFSIPPSARSVVNEEGVSVMPQDRLKIQIGGSLPSARSEALGAAPAVEGVVTEN